jgi:hypothetical protein
MTQTFSSEDAARLRALEERRAERSRESTKIEAQIQALENRRAASGREVIVEIPVTCLVAVHLSDNDVADVVSVRCAPPDIRPGYVGPRRHFQSGNELLADEAMRLLESNIWIQSPVQWGFMIPTIVSISPSEVWTGSSTEVTITGSDFLTDASLAGPEGVIFSDLEIVSSSTMTATMKVSSTAPTGTDLPVTVCNSARNGYGRVTENVLTIMTSDARVPVVASMTIERAREIAVDSIHGVGGHEVEMVNDSSVVGWIGNPSSNIPDKARIRLSVTIAPAGPNGPVQLLCEANPGSATSLAVWRRCQDLAQLLASEISKRLP